MKGFPQQAGPARETAATYGQIPAGGCPEGSAIAAASLDAPAMAGPAPGSTAPAPAAMRFPEQFRLGMRGTIYENHAGDQFGMFLIPGHHANGRPLRVMANDGQETGWEHVSVSVESPRPPSWEEMCLVKDLFWDPEACVVQYHPPQSEYVNIHRSCLHLWRPVHVQLPRPPRICV